MRFMWTGRAASHLVSEATTAAPEPASSERLDTYRCSGEGAVPGRPQVELASVLHRRDSWARLARPWASSGRARRVPVERLLRVPVCAGLWRESGD